MPKPQSWIEKTFGRFDWHDDPARRGAVIIPPEWISANIARIQPPFALRDGLGRPLSSIPCHGLIAELLIAILVDIKDRALCHLINTFDGCFVPRHMSWDPARSLSHHSWGIAVDVNARLFPYGSKTRQNAQLIAAFRRRGFEWGGDWSTPDPMHFEIVTLEAVPADQTGMKIVIDDQLVSSAGRLIGGIAEGPLDPVVRALNATLTPHPEQGKLYIYTGRETP